MSRPSLSVVLPTRNHSRLVGRAIEAIATQSWPPIELLAIDDASTDDTPAVLAALAARFPMVRVIRNEKNAGVAEAVNAGLRVARGDFVYCAASDDWVLPGAFDKVMSLAAEFPRAGIVFGAMFQPGRPPVTLGRVRSWTRPLFAPPELFFRECLDVEGPGFAPCGGAIWRREPFLEIGGLRAELGSMCDAFAFRVLGAAHGAGHVPEPLMVWNVLPGSVSQKTLRDPRGYLDVVARSAALLRSERFGPLFPPGFVDRWEREFRAQILDAAPRALDRALAELAASDGLVASLVESLRPGARLRDLLSQTP